MKRAIALAIGLMWSNAALAADLGTDAQKAAGKELYEKHCAHCHGLKGAAEAPAAPYYRPLPRDFTRGKFKVRSTGTGELPTDQDLKLAIQRGLAFHIGSGAYTTMPPWERFNDEQLMNLVYYVKTFAAGFSNNEYNNPKAVNLPAAPAFTKESAERGRKVFENNECIKCHGTVGRGDGPSAPTLKDDWENHIHPADLTRRWTFRGGSTREDIFRTITTGFNGTPMPAYGETVNEADRWDLVDYVYSLSRGDEPHYNKPDKPIVVAPIEGAIDLSDMAKAKALFETAKPGFIPISGQVIEPGREFHPWVNELAVKAVYNKDQLAVMVTWHDMTAETTGENGPDIKVEEVAPAAKTAAAPDANADPFAEEEAAAAPAADPFAEEEGGTGAAAAVSKYSDAVAVQFPVAKLEGFKLPYFIFGDGTNAVDLWFADLAQKDTAKHYVGKGSASVTAKESKELSVVSEYDKGEWTVIFRRPREAEGSLSFAENELVPVAFSVWDGFTEQRGNKRGLTSWYSLYLEPLTKESAAKPMLLYGGGIFLLELILIGYVRRSKRSI